MNIHNLPLSQVDAARLESLRENAVAEDTYLDYKERLPELDSDKGDLACDVVAFASTAGGDLIYGVREIRDDKGPTGVPEAIVGLPDANLDKVTLALENMLRDSIAPRIPGLRVYPVHRGADPPCLIIRVPKSPLGPHMVTHKGLRRFFWRGSAGKFPLDWSQIRAGFLEAQMSQERLKEFRIQRLAELLAGRTPIRTEPAAKVMFHALPLDPVDVWATFLELDVLGQVLNVLPPMGGDTSNYKYNLDGFVVHTTRQDLARQTYVQLFRDGGIEAVAPLNHDPSRGGFHGEQVESMVIQAVTHYQKLWQLLGVTGPMMMALTLVGVHGSKILLGLNMVGQVNEETFGRDVVSIPEIVVQDPSAPADRSLKPLFDMMWNAGGWPWSPFYAPTGERRPSR